MSFLLIKSLTLSSQAPSSESANMMLYSASCRFRTNLTRFVFTFRFGSSTDTTLNGKRNKKWFNYQRKKSKSNLNQGEGNQASKEIRPNHWIPKWCRISTSFRWRKKTCSWSNIPRSLALSHNISIPIPWPQFKWKSEEFNTRQASASCLVGDKFLAFSTEKTAWKSLVIWLPNWSWKRD